MSESTDPKGHPTTARPGRGLLFGLFFGALVVAYGLDQLSKFLVSSNMVEGERIPVLPPVLHWYYIRNPGAAFSIFEDYTWVFTIIMSLVSVGIIVVIRKVGSKAWALALGLVLAGALGNLTDRLFQPPSFGQGHVVDFIQVPNFAIFNIADSAVVCGVALIVILTLRGIAFDGTREGAGTQKPEGSGHDDDAQGSEARDD